MSRPGGVGPVPAMPAPQPSVPPSVPSGGQLSAPPPTAPTAGAIGRALGPGTSDQEKVLLLIYFPSNRNTDVAFL